MGGTWLGEPGRVARDSELGAADQMGGMRLRAGGPRAGWQAGFEAESARTQRHKERWDLANEHRARLDRESSHTGHKNNGAG